MGDWYTVARGSNRSFSECSLRWRLHLMRAPVLHVYSISSSAWPENVSIGIWPVIKAISTVGRAGAGV